MAMTAAAAVGNTGSGAYDFSDMTVSSPYSPEPPTADEMERDQDTAAHSRELTALFNECKHDRDGNIDADGLKKLIQDYSQKLQLSLQPVNPKPDEILWILNASGRKSKGKLSRTEIDLALKLWSTYLSDSDRVESLIDKHFSHSVETSKVKQFLTAVFDGRRPHVSLGTSSCSRKAILCTLSVFAVSAASHTTYYHQQSFPQRHTLRHTARAGRFPPETPPRRGRRRPPPAHIRGHPTVKLPPPPPPPPPAPRP